MPVHVFFQFLPAWLDALVSSGLENTVILNVPHPFPTTHPYESVFMASSTDSMHFSVQLPGSQNLWLMLVYFAWMYLFLVNPFFKLFTFEISQLDFFSVVLSKLFWLSTCSGEICGFRIHGQNVPFEAVVLDKSTGEGVIRAKDKLDCELQKEHTFTIQAYDCGEGPDGANMKKSHK